MDKDRCLLDWLWTLWVLVESWMLIGFLLIGEICIVFLVICFFSGCDFVRFPCFMAIICQERLLIEFSLWLEMHFLSVMDKEWCFLDWLWILWVLVELGMFCLIYATSQFLMETSSQLPFPCSTYASIWSLGLFDLISPNLSICLVLK